MKDPKFLDYGPLECAVPILFAIMVNSYTNEIVNVDGTLVSIALLLFKLYGSEYSIYLKNIPELFVYGYVIFYEGILNRTNTHYSYPITVAFSYLPFTLLIKVFPKTFNLSELFVLLNLNSFVMV